MSIYRRTERSSPTDDRVDQVPRPADASAAPDPQAEESSEEWSKRRKTEPSNGLLKPTFAWASTLPVEVQPRSLLYKFPRIANLMAAMWPDPNSFRRYMDDLLVDKRRSPAERLDPPGPDREPGRAERAAELDEAGERLSHRRAR